MTSMESSPRGPAPKKVPVRVVDSDVHPVPKPGVLAQYVPEPFRSKYLLSHPRGETIFYDAPDYAHAKAMRVDAFTPEGGFPGRSPSSRSGSSSWRQARTSPSWSQAAAVTTSRR